MKIMQNNSQGQLQVRVNSSLNNQPVTDATVEISSPEHPGEVLEQLRTDTSGQTDEISLPAPPLSYSLEPGSPRPYSEYTITVRAAGFEPLTITGSEILPDSLSLQPVRLTPLEDAAGQAQDINIPEHTLYGDYPAKIPEDEVKPTGDSGEIVLKQVVIPEFIVVHDGVPLDSSAPNYYVPYADYIKNVASSEIYSTWPVQALYANILAIQSFTLNRVYTEWYRNRGFNFTITSSTAYDHKFIYERNIFEEIDEAVDEVFQNFLSRPNVKQPLMTQYCDGKDVSCPGWMTQWGSKSLADQGYSAIEILRHYYGDNIYINQADQISGVPVSWPGYNLSIGSRGDEVRHLQEQLNAIASVYSAIPNLIADGIYGENTAEAVRSFQSIFGLSETGEVNRRTWYKISQIYVGVTRIGETASR